VNNKEIYQLETNKPVIIEVKENYPKVVVTDGFHFTKPVELSYREPSYYNFQVACVIDDMQLLGGTFFLVLFYLLGFFTGIFILKAMSFIPIALFLLIFYFNRRSFIKIKQNH